jgi:DNA-binding transcriptional regulator YiaG
MATKKATRKAVKLHKDLEQVHRYSTQYLIKKLEKLGLKPIDIADALLMSVRTVYRWRDGYSIPRRAALAGLKRILKEAKLEKKESKAAA